MPIISLVQDTDNQEHGLFEYKLSLKIILSTTAISLKQEGLH